IIARCLWALAATGYRLSAHFDSGVSVVGRSSLQDGWLYGRRVDLSDGQWKEFRQSMPALALVMGAFVAISRLLQSTRPTSRVLFYIVASVIFAGLPQFGHSTSLL
ncbi:unnamed protein product, partial [Ostreobium quekettii]